jgi:hypothetical protein
MGRRNAAITELHALMRQSTIPQKDFEKHVRQISGTNDRLVAIVCAAVVELNLASLIETFLRNGSGELFDPNRPPLYVFRKNRVLLSARAD